MAAPLLVPALIGRRFQKQGDEALRRNATSLTNIHCLEDVQRAFSKLRFAHEGLRLVKLFSKRRLAETGFLAHFAKQPTQAAVSRRILHPPHFASQTEITLIGIKLER